ncbi:MAG: putative sulfate exporter family transporter, partial [Alistipes sp.]|nr:putative sulfate exporter family transporter [Alistipes sp.]
MLKKYDKVAYIITLSLLSVFVLMSCFPTLSAVGGFVTPPVALFVGLVYALLFGKPFASFNKKMSKVLLQYSVVGLGFGMNLYESLASGGSGMLFTIVSVFGTLAIGWFIGCKLLGVDRNISYLISSGTAICGG